MQRRIKHSQRLRTVIALLLTITVLWSGSAFAAATIASPDYRDEILDASSQTATAWTNVAPNALASYFTYVPYKNADAVALGFPSSCGNPNAVGATAEDAASTDDCYTITVKKFPQELSLQLPDFGGPGLVDPSKAPGTGFGPITKVHGYGSGGVNWAPPGAPDGVTVTGNAPVPFVNGQFGTSGIWHYPAPTFRGTKGRPVRIQWLNELPNEKPTGFDPTLCEGMPADCYPYNRIVTHVHGAHVGPESDGFVHAWSTPDFDLTGPGWESTVQHGPEGTYYYPMDQEAGTIWYHDHSQGLTHQNTNMGMAGFFPITDENEMYLQGKTIVDAQALPKTLPNALPNPGTKVVPTDDFELGFALQDRIFYENGQLAMPDAPIIDALYPTCTYTYQPDGTITPVDPLLCAPLFMKASDTDDHLVPYFKDNNGLNVPLLATSTTLEFFGNMPVVNGVVYAKYPVEPRVYRMRILNGSDSRTWIPHLKTVEGGTTIPFYQIGTEQGLLNKPVARDNFIIMPGERADFLVDFSSVANLTNKQVVMENLGPDAPYQGAPIPLVPQTVPSDPLVPYLMIPEIMMFEVSTPLSGVADVPAPATITNLRPLSTPVPVYNAPASADAVRKVSLIEITDAYGRTMPTVDMRGFMMTAITELPRLGNTEVWEIINTTADSHPMHLHQVAFQLINREGIALNPDLSYKFTPPGPLTEPSYEGDGAIVYPAVGNPDEHEIGWKDTIMCPPGTITRVRAKFDIPGLYVWHCHILSHEEHDMMRPFVVTTPATDVMLDASTPTDSQLSGWITPMTFMASAVTGIAAYPDGSGFEYKFTVKRTTPTVGPEVVLAPSMAPMFAGSTPNYSAMREAAWTPPSTPGTYEVKVYTKAIGAVDENPLSPTYNPVKTATLSYTIAGPAIAEIDSATAPGAYKVGSSIDITLTFNQPVRSTTGLTVTLNNGATVKIPAFTSSSAVSGTYTIATNQDVASLDVSSIAGTIIDHANHSVSSPAVPTGFNLSSNRLITVYTTPPPATYDSAPKVTITTTKLTAPTNVTSGQISFTGLNYLIFQCKLDAGAFSTCTSPYAYSNLADGSHTFSVKAINRYGVQSAAAVYSWKTDKTVPTVSAFTVAVPDPAYINSKTIAIATLTAADSGAGATGLAGYKITENNTPPLAAAGGWSTTKPVSYTTTNTGTITLYAWVKDKAGNVSPEFAFQTVNIDITKPTVDSFAATTPVNGLTIPVTDFTVTDLGGSGVDKYLITTSATVPPATAAGWNAVKPQNYTFTATGTYKLYPWVKDKAGNISAVATPQTVVSDMTKPTVTVFTVTTPANSTTVPVTAFTATDNTNGSGVDKYLITESATTPLANDAGWGAKPLDYAFQGQWNSGTSKTLYAWVKDTIGNISLAKTATVLLDTAAPTVSGFAVAANINKLTIPISFTAADNVGGTGLAGYKITEDSNQPGAKDAGWLAAKPTAYTTVNTGSLTLSVWVKDKAGNVSSAGIGTSGAVNVDMTKPTVDAFTLTSVAINNAVPVASFDASDNIGGSGVAKYLITTTATTPAATATGWNASKPQTYPAFTTAGQKTLYAWVMDSAGNISLSKSAQVTITP